MLSKKSTEGQALASGKCEAMLMGTDMILKNLRLRVSSPVNWCETKRISITSYHSDVCLERGEPTGDGTVRIVGNTLHNLELDDNVLPFDDEPRNLRESS